MGVHVMVVDDSAVVRGLMTKALEQDPQLQVVAAASDGQMAVDLVRKHLPDVVVLDVEMPHMDGLTALPLILRVAPKTKIIMVSGVEENLARIAVRALELGAAEYMVKPMQAGAQVQIEFYRELREKMKALAPEALLREPRVEGNARPPMSPVPAPTPQAAKISPLAQTGAMESLRQLREKQERADVPFKSVLTPSETSPPKDKISPQIRPATTPLRPEERSEKPLTSTLPKAPVSGLASASIVPAESAFSRPSSGAISTLPMPPAAPLRAIAIASSTGGPQALKMLFSSLLGKVPKVPIFITQHMPASFTTVLAEHIAKASGVPCHEGVDGELVRAGHIYLAPGGFHMTARRQGDEVFIRTDQSPPVNFCRPAADPMFRALSEIYGDGLLAVVLTGMGQDGMVGADLVVKRGGVLLAQDEASSVVYGMPRAVAERGICHAILPLKEIPTFLVRR